MPRQQKWLQMPQVSVFKLKLILKWDLLAHSLHKLTLKWDLLAHSLHKLTLKWDLLTQFT